jgi:hypothetical protein
MVCCVLVSVRSAFQRRVRCRFNPCACLLWLRACCAFLTVGSRLRLIWINPTPLRHLDDPGSIKTLGLGRFLGFSGFLLALLLFDTLFCFSHLCLWSKLLEKFYKFLYIFLLIFVMFLCVLFTENLDEKILLHFLALFLCFL